MVAQRKGDEERLCVQGVRGVRHRYKAGEAKRHLIDIESGGMGK